jgi:hypothetical protein
MKLKTVLDKLTKAYDLMGNVDVSFEDPSGYFDGKIETIIAFEKEVIFSSETEEAVYKNACKENLSKWSLL